MKIKTNLDLKIICNKKNKRMKVMKYKNMEV